MKQKSYNSKLFIKLNSFFQRYSILRYAKALFFFIDRILLWFIKKPRKTSSGKKQVLIVYNMALGDSIIFMCAAHEIRRVYPESEYEITIMVQQGIQALFENEKIFDSVIKIDFTKAAVSIKDRYLMLKKIRNKYYDVVLDPVGVSECTMNLFVSRAAVSKHKIGITDTTIVPNFCPKWMMNRVYDRIIQVKQPNTSLISFYEYFVRELLQDDFKIGFIKTQKVEVSVDLPAKYVIIFPNASGPLKKWPIERYAEIAKRQFKKTKFPIVLCGTDADHETTNMLKKSIESDVEVIDIVGQTTLLEFIEVVRNAELIITNDTSTYHIGVVNEVPTAIITGGYTYARYVDYTFKRQNEFSSPTIIVHQMPCFNCNNKCDIITKDDKIWPCLDRIDILYAWKLIEQLIENRVLKGE